MLSAILDNLVFVIASVTLLGLIIAFVWFWVRNKKDVAPVAIDYDDAHAEPVPPPPEEVVDFAAFAPRSVTPNCRFRLDIFAYLRFQYSDVSRIAKEFGQDVDVGRKIGVPVSRGALLTIKVDIPKLSVDDPVDTLVWTGEPANAAYTVKVPEGTPSGDYRGEAIIGCEGLTIAKLRFSILVSPIRAPSYVDNSSEIIFHKTAFASYASQDRAEVLARIQGMKKVAPQLDIFIDFFSLRSGDNWQEKLAQHVRNTDTFFLFWSHYAAQSVWVEREWRMALKERGIDYIDPVPLEEPDVSPPPDELKGLHFSDAYVAYIHYQRLKDEIMRREDEIEREIARIRASAVRGPGGKCARGHLMDPSWDSCPYCEAEIFKIESGEWQVGSKN